MGATPKAAVQCAEILETLGIMLERLTRVYASNLESKFTGDELAVQEQIIDIQRGDSGQTVPWSDVSLPIPSNSNTSDNDWKRHLLHIERLENISIIP